MKNIHDLFSKEPGKVQIGLSLLGGFMLFIRPGVYVPSILLTNYVLLVHFITHSFVALSFYAVFVYIAYKMLFLVSREIHYTDLFKKLGLIELPRLFYGLSFYLYYAFGEHTKFTPLLVLIVVIGFVTQCLRIFFLYQAITNIGQVSMKKALLITTALLLILIIVRSLFDPTLIDHPYVSIFFKSIDI